VTPPTADPGTPAEPLRLCDSTEIEERGTAFVWDVLHFHEPMRAFALRIDGRVVAYLNRCRHVPVEMDWQPGQFLDSERRFIVCSIHGAAYDPEDGRCVGGPCGRSRLTELRVEEASGGVHWYPSQDTRPVFDGG
jgi:nitrite reductase/ring-hydroxylating ferredoxin subunit